VCIVILSGGGEVPHYGPRKNRQRHFSRKFPPLSANYIGNGQRPRMCNQYFGETR